MKKLDYIMYSELFDISSCVDMLCMHFKKENSIFCLHIQSEWSIKKADYIIICKNDMFWDKNGKVKFTSHFNEYEMNNSKFAVKLEKLKSQNIFPLKVIDINLLKNNRLYIRFNDEYNFITYSDNNSGELWRFFEKGNYEDEHLVAYITNIVME